MSKRRFTVTICLVCIGVLILAGLGVCAIWRVNQEINGLNQSLKELEERVEEEEESHLDMEGSSDIPDLDPHKEGWKITQFGDVLASQEMCYTITTDTGLVIVDGGWDYEAPLLREIIAQYGNNVEAWILTHPHEDHITAFMDLYDDPQGIQIQKIYAVEMPDLDTLESNASWDDFSTLERFLTMDIPELTYVHTGDSWQALGLTFNVLSAYEDRVDEISDDLVNDGSMMFRVSGQKETMLFCADIGKSMSDELIAVYGETLKSDYLQMGHHGFGGLNSEFYELVDPKIAFFDAPDSLMNGENEKSTQDNVALMESMGVEIFSYYTAPNQIILE